MAQRSWGYKPSRLGIGTKHDSLVPFYNPPDCVKEQDKHMCSLSSFGKRIIETTRKNAEKFWGPALKSSRGCRWKRGHPHGGSNIPCFDHQSQHRQSFLLPRYQTYIGGVHEKLPAIKGWYGYRIHTEMEWLWKFLCFTCHLFWSNEGMRMKTAQHLLEQPPRLYME